MNDLVPDYSRGVFLQGQIHQQLIDQVTPKVIELQFTQPGSPISVFIDSPGGDPNLSMRLLKLIRAPKPGGTGSHRVVSCITGLAASAAADFAIQSDYCYIAPAGIMMCHGTSRGAGGAVNAQTAEYLASALRRTNEWYARVLARAAFPRLLLRFVFSGSQELAEFIRDPAIGLPRLAAILQRNLYSFQLHDLMTRALQRQDAIRSLSRKVQRALSRKKTQAAPIDHEAAILRAVLDEQLKLARKSNASLAHGGIDAVVADFHLLHDYYFGDLNSITRTWLNQYGVMFLDRKRHVQRPRVMVACK